MTTGAGSQGRDGAPGAGEVAAAVQALVSGLRWAARQAGFPEGEVDDRVADTLAFLRRRITGEFTVDEFGFDEDFTEHVFLPMLRPLYRSWFRVEVRGVHHLPDEGGALVVANHSGTIALDSLMTQLAVHDEHPARRHLRMLGADMLFASPVAGELARRFGSTLANPTDAERLLGAGEIVGVWPEGFKGIGKPYQDRYRLQRFGRGGFVASALRSGAPIIPCSIVGAEEIYPILGYLPALSRALGTPYFPVTPLFPHFGPLGLVPLPSKWIIEFGRPLSTDRYGPEAADDPILVLDLTDQVRETVQRTLYSLLARRGPAFF
ncbi:1-acyl-sn-glycerol-3-phosphate acyltransferase [Austwickia chelonae]|uniref:Putative acyltransferase n=1 Tax=Austwickia chelonae NBRC 105200 TaxID=1184607 RepID=K6VNE8_9MICO|nr:lysophospholipid acyltransferase family protein [Austwickia chelonae]GAB76905.1 putative acyltransferase [Austwickia chelonae NBRC 105200]SEW32188.1 1-acyl-sn-glycerol-3-phosphate acyltransferase [Austwickia chelonae]